MELKTSNSLHKQTLSIAAAAAQFQTTQASTSAPRHQPAATFTTATSTAHPVKQRGQTTAQASQLGQAQPQPPPHTIQQSVLPQRLVLTSQAQARLPSKWPPLSRFLPPFYYNEVKLLGTLKCVQNRCFFFTLLISLAQYVAYDQGKSKIG